MSDLDNQPIGYWKGNALYLTMYLTLGLAAGLVVTLLLDAAGLPALFLLGFNPTAVVRGWVWQPLTYIFVNRLDFFTPLALFCFYAWGVEVEKYLGRRFFLGLCAALVLAPAFFSLLLYPILGPKMLAGDYTLITGLLIAFATLYPDMDYLGGWVPLKWFAFVCVACGSITYFPPHDWLGLGGLWLNCFLAFYMVRNARGLFDWKLPRWPTRRPRLRVLPRPVAAARSHQPPVPAGPESEMDALLDKIARDGLASLTAAERERLEKAREEMIRKGR